MNTLDKAKQKAESVGCGLALYALEPGRPWLLEVVWHRTGEVYTFPGATVDQCLEAAGLAEDEPPAHEPPAEDVDPFA